jgi:hypothetical protein
MPKSKSSSVGDLRSQLFSNVYKEENDLIKGGILYKRGIKNTSWKVRFFVLTSNKLTYYRKEGIRKV